MELKFLNIVLTVSLLTSVPRVLTAADRNIKPLSHEATSDVTMNVRVLLTDTTTFSQTDTPYWTNKDSVIRSSTAPQETLALSAKTTTHASQFREEGDQETTQSTSSTIRHDRITEFNITTEWENKNDEDFREWEQLQPVTEKPPDEGNLFSKPKEPLKVMFANVTIEGCENGMRCTEICSLLKKQIDNNNGEDHSTRLNIRFRRAMSPIVLPKAAAMVDGLTFHLRTFESSRSTMKEKLSNLFSRKISHIQLQSSEDTSERSLIRRRRGASQGGASFICKCDPICIDFGDCCADKLLYCFDLIDKDAEEINTFFTNRGKEERAENVSDVPLSEALTDDDDLKKVRNDFLATFGSCVRVDDFGGDRVISSCPKGFADKTTAAACESRNSPLLPLVSVAIGRNFYFTFKNAYCAACHGIERSRLIVWKPSIRCVSDIDILSNSDDDMSLDFEKLSNLVLSGSSQVHFSTAEPIAVQRSCVPGYDVTPELKTELDYAVTQQVCTYTEAMLCMAYILPMEESRRNPHCEKCTSVSARKRRSSETGCWNDLDNSINNARPSGGILVLLDVTGKYSQSGTSQESYFCRDNQIFDPLELSCRDFTCSEGEEPYRGVCTITDGVYLPASSQLFPDQWNTTMLSITHSLTDKGKIIDCANVINFLQRFATSEVFSPKIISFSIQSYNPSTARNEDNIFEETFRENIQCKEQYRVNESDVNFQEFKLLLASKAGEYDRVSQDINRLSGIVVRSFLEGNGTVRFTNIDVLLTPSSCPSNQVLAQLEDFDSRTHKGIEYLAINVSGVQFNFPMTSVGFESSFNFNSRTIMAKTSRFLVSVCLQSNILKWENCSLTTYWHNETKYTESGNKLKILRSGREFEKSQVYEVEDKILVCDDLSLINKSVVPGSKLETDEIYEKLNWICSSISIVFLVVMLMMYWVFPELLTLPGRLIACMAATMMLSFTFNLLTLVDLHHKVMCPVAAVIAHFVTLAHYGWMSAIAVNMSLTFGFATVRCQSAEEGGKLFRRYSVVVWGISALIVATSLTLDLTHGEEESNPVVQSFFGGDLSTSLPTELLPTGKKNYSTNDTPTSEPFLNSKRISVNDSENMNDEVNSDDTSIISDRHDNFPRYGSPLCTWFSGPLWVRLAFILVPFGITFVIDVIGFALTVHGIMKSTKASAEMLDRQIETKSQVIIFLKLSTTMGISWAISVFFTVSESRVLVYIYTSLVLLQGLLLFLAFMANKRVAKLVMKRCTCTSRWLYKVKLSTLQNNSSSNSTQSSEVRFSMSHS